MRRIGIVGAGAIALANAAWLRSQGHAVTLWPGRTPAMDATADAPPALRVQASGIVQASVDIALAHSAQTLCADAELLLIAVPANGHKAVMDALLPWLREAHTVIVSSMASLSSLYLFEAAKRRGVQLTVASFGTTVFTARREAPGAVRVLTRRTALGVSALPQSQTVALVDLCTALFGAGSLGAGFSAHAHSLASALTNTNPAAHVPLAVFNWTRIERAEAWPQYHYMTPRVAAVIEQLDGERLALARAFGVQARSMEQHFAQSFGTTSTTLAEIARELHAKRGGPPGPTDMGTRYLEEDLPFGLVFCAALGRMAGVPMTATQAMIDTASLIAGKDFAQGNDLLEPLALASESVEGLLLRVSTPS